jgi:hypothetical protein
MQFRLFPLITPKKQECSRSLDLTRVASPALFTLNHRLQGPQTISACLVTLNYKCDEFKVPVIGPKSLIPFRRQIAIAILDMALY